MTVAPPLSACLMIIVPSLAKDVIVLCSEIEIILLTFDFTLGSRGIFVVLAIKVKNVIYVIECRGCQKYYIGETNNLRNRTTLHNQHIRHENLRMIPVSGHIATCSDKDPKYFMFPFFKMNSDSIIARKEKEKHFINKFKPDLNSIQKA